MGNLARSVYVYADALICSQPAQLHTVTILYDFIRFRRGDSLGHIKAMHVARRCTAPHMGPSPASPDTTGLTVFDVPRRDRTRGQDLRLVNCDAHMKDRGWLYGGVHHASASASEGYRQVAACHRDGPDTGPRPRGAGAAVATSASGPPPDPAEIRCGNCN